MDEDEGVEDDGVDDVKEKADGVAVGVGERSDVGVEPDMDADEVDDVVDRSRRCLRSVS